MYANRRHVRDLVIKVRLNDLDDARLDRVCARTHKQRATQAYELLVEALANLEAQTGVLAQSDAGRAHG